MAVMRFGRRRLVGATATAVTAVALASLSVLPANASTPHAQGRIVNEGVKGAIDDSYIVILKKGALRADSTKGKDIAKEYGAKIRHTYKKALNGYSVHLSEAKAKELAADPAVASVVQNRTFHVTESQANPPSWGLDRIDQPSLPLDDSYTYPDSAGEGVTAYIIDTGVRITHEDFGGRASYGYDAVDDDDTADDGYGHGTHVAATVAGSEYGVAKKADIVAVRVLDDSGQGTTEQVIAGIDWVTENAVKPAVANMSLGGGVDDALDEAVRNSIASGVTYAVAAGNESADAASSSPARVEEAITVGATDDDDTRAYYSNYGAGLDIFAPGTDITSAWNTSDTATDTISGTSMATPHVTGAAALYLADNPSATPEEVAGALVDSAVPDAVGDPGTGSPNLLLNIG